MYHFLISVIFLANAGKVRHNVIQNIGNLEIVQSTGRLEGIFLISRFT